MQLLTSFAVALELCIDLITKRQKLGGCSMDQILKKAMERRDAGLREAQRWEDWIKAYRELAEPLFPLDAPIPPRTALPQARPEDELDIPSALRASG